MMEIQSMRQTSFKAVLLAAMTLLPVTAFAQVPEQMTYQGVLGNAAGDPVTMNVSMVVRIYADATGGTPVWQETHDSVAVADGVFSLPLGSITPLSADVFVDGAGRWLTLQVESDAEMSPRQAVHSVPYAFRADEAKNADTVGGLNVTELQVATLETLAADSDHGSTVPHDYTTSLPWSAITDRPNVVSSLNGISTEDGPLNIVAGANVVLDPNDADDTLTISVTDGGGVNSHCDQTGVCMSVAINDFSNSDNILSTAPQAGPADDLYWGDAKVATENDLNNVALPYQTAVGTNTASVNTDTDTQLDSMSLDLSPGVYLVVFGATFPGVAGNDAMTLSIYSEGSVVPGSVRQEEVRANNTRSIETHAIVTITTGGTASVQGMARTSLATSREVTNRTLTAVKINP